MGLFEIDHEGVGRILKRAETRRLVHTATENAAAEARSRTEYPVETSAYTTDRAAGAVTIAHPAGVAEQAKHGVLTRSAAAASLDIGGTR